MDRTVARLNIEHYRRLLETETDETKRLMIVRLLAEEDAKLGRGTGQYRLKTQTLSPTPSNASGGYRPTSLSQS